MEHPENPPVPTPDRGRGLRSGLLAAGAAFGMTLAGLGIAGAQTSPTTTPTTTSGGSTAPAPRPGGPGHHLKGASLSTAATAIGIDEADLRTALRSGQSIAQVAESKNVAVAKVVTALVDKAKAHLATHVTAGDLTQAQADERAATLTERITEMVNGAGGLGRGHGPGPRGMRPGASAPAAGGTAVS